MYGAQAIIKKGKGESSPRSLEIEPGGELVKVN